MFSVNLALYSEGRVYSRSEYVGMLEGAGLTDVQSYEVLAGEVPNPSVLFVGTRPA